MNYELRKKGFSLTEVLLAVGTLAIGLMFVAGTFLAGIHFSTIATERTIAAVAAEEAFAKIKIFGVNLAHPSLLVDRLVAFEVVALNPINPAEFAYPSADTVTDKQYYWSALCRRDDPDLTAGLIQVTVFVSRKIAANTRYRNPADPFDIAVALPYPVPVDVAVSLVSGNVLAITAPGREIFINDGYTVVDNQTGRIYRVLERDAARPDRIVLDRPWVGVSPGSVWVIPPPFNSGRYPCIAVYPKVIKF
jgi:hypothetical protein